MSMKFNLAVVNWLAYVADPSVSYSLLGHEEQDKAMLEVILNRINDGNLFSLNESENKLENINELLQQLVNLNEKNTLEYIYIGLRNYFSNKQWIALIIPSGFDSSLDDVLCDPNLLSYLVSSRGKGRGVVLQLDEAPSKSSLLLDVHQSLRVALKNCINWPGILIWSPAGDSVFLPVSSVDFLEIDIEARVQWVFSKLFSALSFDLARFKYEYKATFPEVFEFENKTVNILHLSDLDIGNNISSSRIYCIEQIIRGLVEELGETSKIVPVITGNFMDSPSEKHLNKVASFWQFFSGMGTEQPLLVFGNHDVRKDGNINENYRNAVGFQNSKISWYEDVKLAVISLNTVVHGNLQHGAVGEEQLKAIEYEIEKKKESDDYRFVMLMHHLPAIDLDQNQDVQAFYDKTIGVPFDNGVAIEGADLLFKFVEKYSISMLLHGSRQASAVSNVASAPPVIGCGRSIGVRSKYDDCVYFSMNIISINLFTGNAVSRLLAIRKPEIGIVQFKRHEIINRTLV